MSKSITKEATGQKVANKKEQNSAQASTTEIPDGYMTLDTFGEMFHKKLDECYANLQGNSKQ